MDKGPLFVFRKIINARRDSYLRIQKETTELLAPKIAELGYELYDIEYQKEGKDNVLRIYIDKPEGIEITDCEKVNNNIKEELEQMDKKIDGTYTVEVSSCGIERKLTQPWHYEKYIGKQVKIKLWNKIEGQKEHIGVLKEKTDNHVVISIDNKEITFEKKNIISVQVSYNW